MPQSGLSPPPARGRVITAELGYNQNIKRLQAPENARLTTAGAYRDNGENSLFIFK